MLRKRVIPSLLLRRGGLVKTRGFKAPAYVGDPINAVKIFNEKEVDELFLSDITASREGRAPDYELIHQIASEAFMPVAYGGGITSLEIARRVLKRGVEKVTLNTAALRDLNLISALRDDFGAQCVVAVIDVKRDWRGRAKVFSHANAKLPEQDPVAWAQRLVAAGAGEVVVQSVDRDGSMEGFDLDLLRQFRGTVSVPLLAAGGAGSVQDMLAAFEAGALSGVAAGARFVFDGPHRAVLITYLSSAEQAELGALTRRASA